MLKNLKSAAIAWHAALGTKLKPSPTLRIEGLNDANAELTEHHGDLVARLVAAREMGTFTDKTLAQESAERYQVFTHSS